MISNSITGYWVTNDKSNYHYNKELCLGIAEFLQKKNLKTVFDFGCGDGSYIHNLNLLGFQCLGFDGNPNLEKFTKFAAIKDLSVPSYFQKRDCVISINVGEYIPKKFESVFIDNICNNTKDSIVISWSSIKDDELKINCQSIEYLIFEFKKRGFKLNSTDTYEIKNLSHQEVIVFDKIKPVNFSRSIEVD